MGRGHNEGVRSENQHRSACRVDREHSLDTEHRKRATKIRIAPQHLTNPNLHSGHNNKRIQFKSMATYSILNSICSELLKVTDLCAFSVGPFPEIIDLLQRGGFSSYI